MVFATNGVVTKVTSYGNSDKLLWIITEDKGRIPVMAKGVKSPIGKLTSLTGLFTYANYEIYKKNDAYWLKGGSIISSFYELTRDITSLALGTYLCDLANELTDENYEGNEILRMLLNSLHLICQGKKSHKLIKGVFEFRAMCMSGYMPEISACPYCKEFEGELMYLDVAGGKLICPECLNKRNKKIPKISEDFEYTHYASVMCPLSGSVLAALRYVALSSFSKIFSFELTDERELDSFASVCEAYLLEHLGQGFDSLSFYNSVK